MSRGVHIVLEGADCTGKSTLAATLHTRLLDIGRSPRTLRFPSDGPIGKLVRKTLYGKVEIKREALLYLFTADGVDMERVISGWLEVGHDIICDRHPTLSGWVYQRQEHPLSSIEAVHQTAPVADHDGLFVVDIPAEVALKRQHGRSKDIDVVYEPALEDPEALTKVASVRQLYLELADKFQATVLDGLLPSNELTDQIIERMGL